MRNWDGRKTGRRGSPFSRNAEGLNVNSSSSAEGVNGLWSGILLGRGGAPSEILPGTGGGREWPNRASYVEAGDLGGKGGGADGVPDCLYICSFGGRAGAASRDCESDHLS